MAEWRGTWKRHAGEWVAQVSYSETVAQDGKTREYPREGDTVTVERRNGDGSRKTITGKAIKTVGMTSGSMWAPARWVQLYPVGDPAED